MSRPTRAQLAQEVADFAAKITAGDDRWAYAYRSSAYLHTWKGRTSVCFHEKSARALSRILGGNASSVQRRLSMIADKGSVAAARAYRLELLKGAGLDRDPFAVPALEPWHLGHVYFARLAERPHVLKVGFTRRLHDRLEDIESKSHTRFGDVAVRVGTMSDEAWWHHHMKSSCISGEWFFDPDMQDRSLPAFLLQSEAA